MIVYKEFDPVTGIATRVHDTDDRVSIEKTYDAAPFLDAAALERAATHGERWGEFRKVGSIPMAELATMFRQDGGLDPQRVYDWLKANPLMVTFEKFLK